MNQKRYRFCGLERDDETGCWYHATRYYVFWLGRWLSCDPAGAPGGGNLYLYCSGNPVSRTDTNGSEWCGLTDGFFGLFDSDCHIAPEVSERAIGGLKTIGGGLEVIGGGALFVVGAATSEFGAPSASPGTDSPSLLSLTPDSSAGVNSLVSPRTRPRSNVSCRSLCRQLDEPDILHAVLFRKSADVSEDYYHVSRRRVLPSE